MKPVRLEILIDDKTLQGLNSVKGNLGATEQFYKQIIGQLKKELTELQQKMKTAMAEGISTDKQAAEIQALTGVVNQLTDELENLTRAKKQNNATPIMGDDPAPKMNNIKMSMAQIARELPSLAMGPQMFFLAISNNIPLLQDALSSARKEFDALTAAGKTAVPVWKQVAKSIVSPQALLAVGITLLVTYSDEIIAFVKNLFNMKDSLDATAEANQRLNKAMEQGLKDSAKEVAEMELLYRATQDTTRSLKQRKLAVDELQNKYPSYFGNMDKEAILAGKTASAYDKLKATLIAQAQARAIQDELTELTTKKMEAEEKAAKAKAKQDENAIESNFGKKRYNGPTFGTRRLTEESKAYNQATKDLAKYTKEIENYDKQIDKLVSKVDVSALVEDFTADTKAQKDKVNYAVELAKERVKAEKKLEDMRIQVMQEGYKKRIAIAQQQLDNEKARINKEEDELLDTALKARQSGQKLDSNTENQIIENARQQRLEAEKIYWKTYYSIIKDWRDKDIQSLIEYNKEFGDSQEKRMAIIQDYNRKIEAEESEGGKAILRKRMEAELNNLDMEEFKNSIDFSVIFGDLEAQTVEALETLREKLKKYIETMGEELKPEDLKEIQDAFKNIDFNIKSRKPFAEFSKDIKEYKDAQNEVEGAQIVLNQVMEFGSLIVEEYDEATGEVTKKLITQEQAEKNLTDAQKKRKEAMTGIFKSLSGIANEVSMVSNAANSIISSFDSIGIEVGEDVRGIVDGFSAISDGISNMAESAMRGDVAGVVAGVVGTLAGTVKMFGSIFGADFGGERSRRKYEEAKEKYESYMDVIDKVIEKQKELVASMEADDFANANNSYERARKLLKDQQDYAREMGKAYLNSGASKGFLGIGSSSSEGRKQKESISQEAWKQVEELFGKNFIKKISDNRMTGLFDLSYEQLLKLRDEATGFYSELKEDTKQYIDQIIESEEAWREVQEARKEALTKVDFDSFYDSFISTLDDLDATSEDFANNFEDYLKKAIFSALVANQYKTRIEALYNQWVDLADKNGLDSTEADLLRQEYNSIIEDMLAKREEIMKDFGWETEQSKSESQSGRAGAVTTITEETAGKLEGIANAQLDRVIGMDIKMESMSDNLSAMASSIATVAENSEYLKRLDDIADNIQNMNSTGVKIKN